jgi:uncharacterized membrane protein HdeD (DUF308 family)
MTDGTTVRTPDIQQAIRQHRWIFLAEGVLLLLGGIASILLPIIASHVLSFGLGVLCIVIGVFLFIRSLAFKGADDQLSTLVTGVLFCIIAVVLIFWPSSGLEGITLLLAAFCILRGIMDLSGKPSTQKTARGLQVVSGLAGLVLGVLLLLWWPSDAMWAPGLLFGIQLLFLGMAVLAMWSALDHPLVKGPQSTE